MAREITYRIVYEDRILAKVSVVLEGNDRCAIFLAAIESRVYYFHVKGKKVSGRPDTLIVPVESPNENKANRKKAETGSVPRRTRQRVRIQTNLINIDR